MTTGFGVPLMFDSSAAEAPVKEAFRFSFSIRKPPVKFVRTHQGTFLYDTRLDKPESQPQARVDDWTPQHLDAFIRRSRWGKDDAPPASTSSDKTPGRSDTLLDALGYLESGAASTPTTSADAVVDLNDNTAVYPNFDALWSNPSGTVVVRKRSRLVHKHGQLGAHEMFCLRLVGERNSVGAVVRKMITLWRYQDPTFVETFPQFVLRRDEFAATLERLTEQGFLVRAGNSWIPAEGIEFDEDKHVLSDPRTQLQTPLKPALTMALSAMLKDRLSLDDALTATHAEIQSDLASETRELLSLAVKAHFLITR